MKSCRLSYSSAGLHQLTGSLNLEREQRTLTTLLDCDVPKHKVDPIYIIGTGMAMLCFHDATWQFREDSTFHVCSRDFHMVRKLPCGMHNLEIWEHHTFTCNFRFLLMRQQTKSVLLFTAYIQGFKLLWKGPPTYGILHGNNRMCMGTFTIVTVHICVMDNFYLYKHNPLLYCIKSMVVLPI